MTLTAWAKLSPSSNPPPSRMQGGTSPRIRFHLNSFNLVGQSPRWAACLSTGGASVSSVGNERTRRAVHALVVWAGSLSTRALTNGLLERFLGGLGGLGGGHSPKTDLWCFSDSPEGRPLGQAEPARWAAFRGVTENRCGAYWMFLVMIGFLFGSLNHP